jgi:hypothetical protein
MPSFSPFDRIWSHDEAPPKVQPSIAANTVRAGPYSTGQQRALLPVEIRSFNQMLFTIAVILLVLWTLGMTTAYTAAGLIHILLVLAIVMVLIRVIQGRRAI